MQTYLVRRSGIAATAAELNVTLSQLRAHEEAPHGLRARWLHSYVMRTSGQFGLFCVFEADRRATLERHAGQIGLPAQEILPVVTTTRVRRFAPALVYLIRRRNFWTTREDLEASAAVSLRVGIEEMAHQVSWVRTYAVLEDDGSFGTVCIYQAVSPLTLRDHAHRVGMPADEIVPLIGRIVFRQDANELAAHGAPVPA